METTRNFEGKQAKALLHSMYPYSPWTTEVLLKEQERTRGKTWVIFDVEVGKTFIRQGS